MIHKFSLKDDYYPTLVNSFKSLNTLRYVFINSDEVILDYSQGAKNLLGLNEEDINSKLNSPRVFLNLNVKELLKKKIQHNEFTVKASINKDNAIIETLVTIKPVMIKNETFYLLIFRELKGDEKLKLYKDKLYYSIKTIATILSSSLELDDTLEFILKKFQSIINYNVACIMFLDGYDLNIKASKSIEDIDIPQRVSLNDNKDLSEFIRLKETTIINDHIENNPMFKVFKLKGIKEAIFIPLLIKESFFGLMSIFNIEKHAYSIYDLAIIDMFASTSAYSIKNAELSEVFRLQLGILRENVIDRTKALELIRVQNQKILEADKLKNEFLAHMSHELRTPLNSIIGFSEALKLKFFGDLTPKQEEYIDDIHTSGIHLLGMINDMLDLSKIESNKMELFSEDISIELAINEVINVVLVLANKKQITITEIFNHTSDTMNVDSRKFQQILYNLLSNAIKFTPENGSIEVITNDSFIDNIPSLDLTIADTGIGISEEDQQKVFDKFHQIDNNMNRNQGGSGLGLTITKELVEMHNGKISVESNLNQGSKFIVKLPMKYSTE